MQEHNYLGRLFSLELLVFEIIYLYLLGRGPGGGGGTPYNGLYGEAPPERGTFFRLQV